MAPATTRGAVREPGRFHHHVPRTAPGAAPQQSDVIEVQGFRHCHKSHSVRNCVRFLDVEDEVDLHADFLRRLVRRSTRKLRTKVFTTNYDLCFEYAARKGRYVIVDGFSHTTPQVFDSLYFSYDIVKRESSPDSHDFIPNVFHLYKLHGSVDWTRNTKSGEIESHRLPWRLNS